MALPKIDQPIFELDYPSKQTKLKARPFLVKEEKILLTAQQSGKSKDIILALKQILVNCILDEGFDPDELAIYDLEYMFLKLRAQSVGNIIELQYTDPVDEKPIKFNVDLDDVIVKNDKEINNKILLTDDVGIVMRLPSVKTIENVSESLSGADTVDAIIIDCIESFFDADNVYPASESTTEEMEEFISNLSMSAYNKINDWFDSIPTMYYKIEYQNSQGKQVIELKTLDDFFTLQ